MSKQIDSGPPGAFFFKNGENIAGKRKRVRIEIKLQVKVHRHAHLHSTSRFLVPFTTNGSTPLPKVSDFNNL